MDLLSIAEIVLGLLLAAVILPIGWLFVRRRFLSRDGGSFDCGFRRGEGRWRLGMARYLGDEFAWYPAFALTFAPAFTVKQGMWAVIRQRELEAHEVLDLYADQVVVELRDVRDGSNRVELALSRPSATGLLSWVESAPPGASSYGNLSPTD